MDIPLVFIAISALLLVIGVKRYITIGPNGEETRTRFLTLGVIRLVISFELYFAV